MLRASRHLRQSVEMEKQPDSRVLMVSESCNRFSVKMNLGRTEFFLVSRVSKLQSLGIEKGPLVYKW